MISVFVQHGIKASDLCLKTGARQPKKDDTGMSKLLLENQLTEIAVGNDQNSPFVTSDFKDILISKAMGIISGDCLNVMTQIGQVKNKSEVGALVEEEFHRAASLLTPFEGLGETSSPLTTA